MSTHRRKIPQILIPGIGFDPKIPRVNLSDLIAGLSTVETRVVTVSGAAVHELNDLDDVSGTPSTDQFLGWDGAIWTPTSLPAASTPALSGCSDTVIASGAEGDLLVFSTNRWRNQKWSMGPLSVGTSGSPSGTLHLTASLTGTTVESWFTARPSPRSGQRGWIINKVSPTEATPHGIEWAVSGSAKWGMGMDYDTLAGSGNADYVVCFDHTTPNATGGLGSDILRFSPWEASPQGLKVQLAAPAGSPKNNNHFFTIAPGAAAQALSAVQIYASGGSAITHLTLSQQVTGHNAVRMSWHGKWITALDLNGAGTRDFTWYDNVIGTTRLTLKGNADANSYLGIGTASPAAGLHVAGSTSAVSGDWPQHYFLGGYSAISNRSISVSQIVGSTVRNFIMLNGSLSGGTAAAPKLFSNFASNFGLESTDNLLSLITGAAGSAVDPVRGLMMDGTGNVTIPIQLRSGPTFVNSLTVSGSTGLQALVAAGVTANSFSTTGSSTLSGNVGIGTAPVNGQMLTVRPSAAHPSGVVVQATAGIADPLATCKDSSGNTLWRVDPSGSVSIGGAPANPAQLTVRVGSGRTGVRAILPSNADNSQVGFTASTESTGVYHVGFAWAREGQGFWKAVTDLNQVADTHWYLFDTKNSLTRLFVRSDANANAQVGVGTSAPAAGLHILGSTNVVSGDVPQHYLLCGYSAGSNRSITISQIVGATVRNYVMLNGNLSGGTAAAPKIFSNFASCFGLESTDSALALITAAAGSALDPIRGLSMDNTGALTTITNASVGGNLGVGVANGATSAKAHVKSAASGTIALIAQAAASATANIIEGWNSGSTSQFSVGPTGTVTASGRVRAPGIYSPVLAPMIATSPVVTGADTGELEIPYHPKDGTTALTFNVRRIHWRCSTSGSTSGQIRLEKYTGTTAFVGTTIGSVTLPSGSYEANNTTSFTTATLTSGDKIRVFTVNLPTATNWTVCLALESSGIPAE